MVEVFRSDVESLVPAVPVCPLVFRHSRSSVDELDLLAAPLSLLVRMAGPLVDVTGLDFLLRDVEQQRS